MAQSMHTLQKGGEMIKTYRREISKEQYVKAMEHGGRLTEEQELEILGESLVRGYGVYGTAVYMDGGKYMLKYETNDSCD